MTLNTKEFSAGLKTSLNEAKAFSSALSQNLKIPTLPKVTTSTRVDPALAETREQVRKYRDAQNALRTELERGIITNREYVGSATTLQREMLEFQQTLPRLSREWAALDRAIGTAQRGITTASGNVSKLGLSQQIALGLNQELAQSLASTGGIAGGAASLGISAYGGALTGVSTGALAATGGVLALGVGTAALVRRGVPQVKEYQAALNVLGVDGKTDLSGISQALRELQNETGLAGEAFTRAELATALAELVKAGTDTESALTILRTSIKLASAENQNLTDSSSQTLKVLRQFDLEASAAGRAGNVLAQGALLAAGTANDLALGLADVAPIAKNAGLTFEETTGLLIDLDNRGLDAATVGSSGLRSAIAALSKPSKEAQEDIKGLGVSLTNTDGSAKSVRDLLFEVRDAIAASGKDLTEFSRIADTYGLTALLALTDASDEYIQQLQNSEGVLDKYTDKLAQGIPAAQVRAQKALDDLSATVAGVFAPGIEAAANKTNQLVRAINNLATKGSDAQGELLGLDGGLRRLFSNDDVANLEADLNRFQSKIDELKQRNARLTRLHLWSCCA